MGKSPGLLSCLLILLEYYVWVSIVSNQAAAAPSASKFRFIAESQVVTSVLVMHAEATSEAHIDENFKVLDWELSEDDMMAISGVETQNKNVPASMFLKENGPYVTESDVSPSLSASVCNVPFHLYAPSVHLRIHRCPVRVIAFKSASP